MSNTNTAPEFPNAYFTADDLYVSGEPADLADAYDDFLNGDIDESRFLALVEEYDAERPL